MRGSIDYDAGASDVKRTLCKFFPEGKCDKGESCTFAHSEGEIGQLIGLTDYQETSGSNTKRTVCKFWQEGTCERGNLCGFAHGEDEIGAPKSTPISAPISMPKSIPKAKPKPIPMPAVGETMRTICKFYQEGTCDKGVKCGFAHGEDELGMPIAARLAAPSETKRTVCKFWQEGNCEKADGNCTFAHGEHELGEAIPPPRPQHSNPHKRAVVPAFGVEKRTICKFWQDGVCDKGKACGFAHGSRQIGQVLKPENRKPPPAPPVQESEVKRTICKFWQDNMCDKGHACTFAHGEHQIGKKIGAPSASHHTKRDVGTVKSLKKISSVRPISLPVLSNAGNDEVKRTICKFWQEGKCERDFECTFAHGDNEIGQLVSNDFGLSPPRNADTKRTICKFWEDGTCEKGISCTFAHGDEELGQVAHTVKPKTRYQPAKPLSRTTRLGGDEVKRTICKFWQDGTCDKGFACTFAHGERQLGRPAVPFTASQGASDVKRTVCKFWQEGICDKGNACTFIHGNTQSRTLETGEVKRTICKFWEEGKCDKGPECTFAHGDHEIGCPTRAVLGKRGRDDRNHRSKRQRVH